LDGPAVAIVALELNGLDFRKLVTAEPFTFVMFVYPPFVFVVWGFLVGALYAWLHNLLRRD